VPLKAAHGQTATRRALEETPEPLDVLAARDGEACAERAPC
jgi:hypothetical protein